MEHHCFRNHASQLEQQINVEASTTTEFDSVNVSHRIIYNVTFPSPELLHLTHIYISSRVIIIIDPSYDSKIELLRALNLFALHFLQLLVHLSLITV